MTANSTEEDLNVSDVVTIPEQVEPVRVLGTADQVLRTLQTGFPQVSISSLGHDITVRGPAADVSTVADLVRELISVAQTGQHLDAATVQTAIDLLQGSGTVANTEAILTVKDHQIRAKTDGQQRYVNMIERSTVVFGIGPAGTGKTYLAMAMAVNALLTGQVRRIILTRPAVEAGESLGFLPGTLTEKIDPYLRPLYDALGDMVDSEALPRLIASGTIEVAPLAYMRGRTLNDAFIILDEAQNTTASQMKMFLTRLGFGSKVVVTGDATQVDLPGSVRSGLATARDILDGIEGIEFCQLTSADVVRHRLVSQIIDAYDRWSEENPQPVNHNRSRHR
ncbi:PhoH family protein [Gleimia hominis]|uniref:PhoH-like protein n=1 Tax=Gleimia hominis TaxID=595468 RepID=A0ABU3IAS2_9ACTO|nr:PhoH family protein [Gleimia hominis]MDT3767479.1 PhoH family protein [Gleimia hominis]